MEGLVRDLQESERASFLMQERDGQGSTPDIIKSREDTFPQWFKQLNREGESLSRDYVAGVFEKVRDGKPLGKKEVRVAKALFEEARGLREENARQILNFRQERADNFKKEVAAEIDAIAAREAAADMADPYLEPLPNAAARLADDVKAGAEDNMMDAARADFERMVDEMPDYEILMEDGSTRSIKELAEELAEDGKILEAVTVCGVG